MGEHEGWPHPGGMMLNGLISSETDNVTRVLDMERWAKAEERVAELLACIQPNRPTEERRNAVANYVQKLIMKCFSCEVFTFGSVPLKTYLPDGDIDLTAFSKNEDLKDTWANEVRGVLEKEEKNENAEFRVKEVQYIHAEVKLIKCLVENIIVDISMDQVGGLCTLCFLEEIDNLINQNHLFKRSVILIKAWCYYESRILGAHHGLISTYALETLVLYIFHVFNNCFAGPLEVLYRFLEFFSNFDWDNYCVSLWGPVPISSLPDIAAESPRKDDGDLLLSGLFLEACSSVYAVFPSGQKTQSQPFVRKHLNVIDPLRTNNNLGRSVSKGNFYRIRSAFAFGAKRLAQLLDCPKDNLIAEVGKFFMNTWDRHNRGGRPDAPLMENHPLRPLKINPVVTAASVVSGSHASKDSPIVSRAHDHADNKGPGYFEFLRTQSSPELTEACFRQRKGIKEKSGSEHENQRKSTISRDSSIIQTEGPSFEDPSLSLRNADSSSASNSYHDFEIGAASNAFELQQQEDQDTATTMAPSRISNYIGQVQIPMHISSSHPPISLSPYPISTNYTQNLYTLVNPSYGSAIPFQQGFISSQFPHMMPTTDDVDAGNDVPDANAAIREDIENGGSETDDGYFSDERRHFPGNRLGHITSSVMRGPRCFITGNKGNGVILTDRGASWRRVPMEPANSARNFLHSETTRNDLNSKSFKPSRNKWGRRLLESEAANSDLRGTRGGRQNEVSSELALSSQDNVENGGFHSRNRLSGYEQAQMSGADSMISVAPVLIGGPRQRPAETSGILPFTFYPTGPPVPFVTMVPVYNFPTNSEGSHQANDGDSLSDQNLDHFDALVNSNGWENAVALDFSEDRAPDVLNSDFASHWQNLQYGRFCQNARTHGPITYAPIMVPPVYLQGHFPMDGPGRPHSANMGYLTQVVGYGPPRLVPIAPLQPGPGRPLTAFRRLADDSPRYSGGTGTYLPNPKASFRERPLSSSRNHRGGGYKHDRGDSTDREGSWINPKARSAARSHLRIQNERSNLRSDNHSWDSYRHNHFTPRIHNASFRSSNTPDEPIIDHRARGRCPQPESGFNGNESSLRSSHGIIRNGSSRGGSSRSSPDQPSSPQMPK